MKKADLVEAIAIKFALEATDSTKLAIAEEHYTNGLQKLDMAHMLRITDTAGLVTRLHCEVPGHSPLCVCIPKYSELLSR